VGAPAAIDDPTHRAGPAPMPDRWALQPQQGALPCAAGWLIVNLPLERGSSSCF